MVEMEMVNQVKHLVIDDMVVRVFDVVQHHSDLSNESDYLPKRGVLMLMDYFDFNDYLEVGVDGKVKVHYHRDSMVMYIMLVLVVLTLDLVDL